MLFEKRLVYRRGGVESGHGSVEAGGGRRLEGAGVEFKHIVIAPENQTEQKLEAETDGIVLQFLAFTFEDNSDLFDTEKSKNVDLNDVTTAITGSETKEAIKSKLQEGYAFVGYSKDKLSIIWEKNGVKSAQVNPVVLSPGIRPLLKTDVDRKLNALLVKERPLTLETKVKKDFVKICRRLIDNGFINEDKVRGSEFEEDLKDVLRAIYMKAGKGKFDASFDASALIVFDDAGFTLKSADYFGKDIQVSFAIGERAYDENLKRTAVEAGVASRSVTKATLAEIEVVEPEEFQEEEREGPSFSERMEKLSDLSAQIAESGEFKGNFEDFHSGLQTMLADARSVVENGDITSEDQLKDWSNRYMENHGMSEMMEEFKRCDANSSNESVFTKYGDSVNDMFRGLLPNQN